MRNFERRIRNFIRRFQANRREGKWLQKHGRLSEQKRAQALAEISTFAYKPLISVIVPVYNVEEKWLRLCVQSVSKQIYSNWELCIADDCSTAPHIRPFLEKIAAVDDRIKVIFRAENGHISAASNSALELAAGEFIVLLDNDDELSEDALFYLIKEINRFPSADLIYSDEDKIDEKGHRFAPTFKPDWAQDLFYSLNFLNHLSAFRTEIVRKIGGFRLGFEGSQDYDLVLRFIEQIPDNHIRHIPRVLYHWRAIRGSVALGGGEKQYAHERARHAICEHLERTGKDAEVSSGPYDFHRVRYKLSSSPPKVSIIADAKDNSALTDRFFRSFVDETSYPNLEIILISETDEALRYKNLPDFRVVTCELKTKAGRLNFAALQSTGEIICFVDAGLMPLHQDWLAELADFACQSEIGAVGGKVVDLNDRVLHGGMVIGVSDIAGTAHKGFNRNDDGNLVRNRVIGNYSAVSASCMMIRREVFEAVGGFDAKNLPNALFDVDLCLRLRELKYRIVFTPYAELKRAGEKSRVVSQQTPSPEEVSVFRERWQNYANQDPFYNPNFSKKDASFSVDI